MNLRTAFAFDPQDTEEISLEKFAILLVAGACCLAGVVWTAMYYVIFGWGLATALPALFVLIVGASLLASHLTRSQHYAIYAQIICILYITAFIQWSIGGVFDSGFVLAWAFLGPICALMFFSVRQSVVWFALYLVNLGITVAFNGYFASHGQVVPEGTKLFFFTMNLGVASTVVFAFASYYVNSAIKEQREARRLLDANLEQEILLRQSEKLATLGRLSAGVAHELNNPAAATKRGVEQLRDAIQHLVAAKFSLGQRNPTASQLETLAEVTQRGYQRADQAVALDPLTRSDRESEVEAWLEARGVEEAWDFAPQLVDMGFDGLGLSELAAGFEGALPTVISMLSAAYETRNLLAEMGHGTSRIVEIVKALKSYSYLDQAPVQSIDIHEGLDDTLIMLRSELKDGVQVRREYAPDLPRIEACGSELNQVWTNIIDNAVSAMQGRGELVLTTRWQDPWVVVEIEDTGPGIPRDIQDKIFDPFFTTKPPGEGTGLGLNISHNIVAQKHKGRIAVYSRPGETRFEVKLPLDFQGPSAG